jgi:hypothetical protein
VLVGWVQVELLRAAAEARERRGNGGGGGDHPGAGAVGDFTQLLGMRDGSRAGRGSSEGGGTSSTRRGSDLDSQLAAGDYDDEEEENDDDAASLYSADSALGNDDGAGAGAGGDAKDGNAAAAEFSREDRDWPCGPAELPEPWREGVPPEIQRMLEDAFATFTSRVRALLNEQHYHAVDEAVRGRPFVPASEAGGAERVEFSY